MQNQPHLVILNYKKLLAACWTSWRKLGSLPCFKDSEGHEKWRTSSLSLYYCIFIFMQKHRECSNSSLVYLPVLNSNAYYTLEILKYAAFKIYLEGIILSVHLLFLFHIIYCNDQCKEVPCHEWTKKIFCRFLSIGPSLCLRIYF